MKVGGVGGAPPVGAAGSPRRSAASGFTVSSEPARGVGAGARSGSVGAVAGLDALLMLQEEGGPTERRRRAVRRGGALLDKLEAIKLSMLEGSSAAAALDALRRSVHDQRGVTDDPALDEVLDAIDTRAAVELAKAEVAARSAGAVRFGA